jgi:hypothetical protein
MRGTNHKAAHYAIFCSPYYFLPIGTNYSTLKAKGSANKYKHAGLHIPPLLTHKQNELRMVKNERNPLRCLVSVTQRLEVTETWYSISWTIGMALNVATLLCFESHTKFSTTERLILT